MEAGFVRPTKPAAQAQNTDHSADSRLKRPSRAADRALGALVAIVAAAGLAIVFKGLVLAPEGFDWPLLAALAMVAILAERTDLSMYGASRVSLAIVPIFAAIMFCGTSGLAVVVPVAVLASAWGRPLHKTAFNFGTLAIAGFVSDLALDSFGTLDYANDWPEIILPASVAGGANFAVNSIFVAVAISLSTRASIRTVWAQNFMWLLPHYVILAFISLAIVGAYDTIGIWGVAVFIAPPVMMRLSIKQYLDHTTKSVMELENANVQLQHAHDQLTTAMTSLGSAYDGTLRSLVAALDARDSETAGHSERVADLTMAIAAEIGMQPDTDEWRYISWGALLHDVGKIAIPDHILRKPSSLTEEEWGHMRTHPRAGFEILRSVDFLAPAGEIVLAHHERYDGAGYPRGLAGEQIPLGARIFTIADSFDAMTSNRAYRNAMPAEEALAEILRHSGTQFDPVSVRAFLSVYQKRFVGGNFNRHSAGSHGRGHRVELSESLKRAIAEAAGIDRLE